MALRQINVPDQNPRNLASRRVVPKTYIPKPDIRPRAALGSVANITEERGAEKNFGKNVKATVPYQALPTATIKESAPKVEAIDDIDLEDAENPQLCADYVKDIYVYMMELEKKHHVPPTYFETQTSINSKMRCILIDWLVQVHLRFKLLQETLYLAVCVIDRYLACRCVQKTELQLVGVTAMLIACKYEEMYAPEVRDFVYITDNSYTDERIRAMEREMLKALDYSLGTPLCLHFLRRYSRAGKATPSIHATAKFLMELCLQEYSMLQFYSSQVAASALYIALKVHSDGEWTATLRHYTKYSLQDLRPCVSKMVDLVVKMHSPEAKQQAVKNKHIRIAQQLTHSKLSLVKLAK